MIKNRIEHEKLAYLLKEDSLLENVPYDFLKSPTLKFLLGKVKTHYKEFHKKPAYETLLTLCEDDPSFDFKPMTYELIEDLYKPREDYEYTRKTLIEEVQKQETTKVFKGFAEVSRSEEGVSVDYVKTILKKIAKISAIGDIQSDFDHNARDIGELRPIETNRYIQIPPSLPSMRRNFNSMSFERGLTYSIIARANEGKTAFLTWLGYELSLLGYNVVYAEFENTIAQVEGRVYANVLKKPTTNVTQWDEHYLNRKYKEILDKKGQGIFHIKQFKAGSTKVSEVKKYLDYRYKARGVKTDILIIDQPEHLALEKSDRSTGSKWDDLGTINKHLAGLATEEDLLMFLPLHTKASVKKESHRKDLTMDDVGYNRYMKDFRVAFILQQIISEAEITGENEGEDPRDNLKQYGLYKLHCVKNGTGGMVQHGTYYEPALLHFNMKNQTITDLTFNEEARYLADFQEMYEFDMTDAQALELMEATESKVGVEDLMALKDFPFRDSYLDLGCKRHEFYSDYIPQPPFMQYHYEYLNTLGLQDLKTTNSAKTKAIIERSKVIKLIR